MVLSIALQNPADGATGISNTAPLAFRIAGVMPTAFDGGYLGRIEILIKLYRGLTAQTEDEAGVVVELQRVFPIWSAPSWEIYHRYADLSTVTDVGGEHTTYDVVIDPNSFWEDSGDFTPPHQGNINVHVQVNHFLETTGALGETEKVYTTFLTLPIVDGVEVGGGGGGGIVDEDSDGLDDFGPFEYGSGIAGSVILWPIRFTETAYALKVTTGETEEVLSLPTVVAGRNYWTVGDGQTDTAAHGGTGDLLLLFEQLLNTNSAGRTYTVTSDFAGYITVSVDSGTFILHWIHIDTTLDGRIFGYPGSVESDELGVAAAPYEARGWWAPGRVIAKDTDDVQPVAGAVMPSLGGRQTTAVLALPAKVRDLVFTLVLKEKTRSIFRHIYEPTGTLEDAWLLSIIYGRQLRVYQTGEVRTPTSYRLYVSRSHKTPWTASDQWGVRYTASLELRAAP